MNENELAAVADAGAGWTGTWRNRIKAARMPRAAFHEAADGEGKSDEQAVFLQSLAGVV